MSLKDFGPDICRYICGLNKEQLDQLLLEAGVRIEEMVFETPELLKYTCAVEQPLYKVTSAYSVASSLVSRVA